MPAHAVQRPQHVPGGDRVTDGPQGADCDQAHLRRAVPEQRQQVAHVGAVAHQAQQVGGSGAGDHRTRPQLRHRAVDVAVLAQHEDEVLDRLAADLGQHRRHRRADGAPCLVVDREEVRHGRTVVVLTRAQDEQRHPVGCERSLGGPLPMGPDQLGHDDEDGEADRGQGDHDADADQQALGDHALTRASTTLTRWSSSRGLNGLMT